MCGRYVRKSSRGQIARSFDVDPENVAEFPPSYNVAPQTFQPVVRLNRDTGAREVVLMRWGLVPYWSKEPKIGYSTINAKAEKITTSPSFREAMLRRRCLVPSDAFYEWQKLDTKNKQPFAIELASGGLYAFAGLWDRWRDLRTREPLETFTIITTDANELLAPLHDRMPVILEPKDYQRWLTPGDPERLPVDLLRPYPAEKMRAWKVDRRVGNAKNDSPDLLNDLLDRPSANHDNLFSEGSDPEDRTILS
jgi:putative SOS response-associated peptidase YedK